MKKILGLLVFVSLLLNACAPAIPGSSRFTAFDARETNQISITAGAEWFVKTTGPTNLVSLRTRNADLNNLILSTDVSLGNSKSSPINWFKVLDFKAPSGWAVELVGQFGIRKIIDVDTDGSYTYSDSSELTWSIKVPPTTLAGIYPVSISIASRDNLEQPAKRVLSVTINRTSGKM
jgi:hypothetical protein